MRQSYDVPKDFAGFKAIFRTTNAMLHRLERHRRNLEHSRWRVDFLLSLLDSHRKMQVKRDARWEEKEREYLKQLALAQAELDRLDRHEMLRWREDQPMPLRSTSASTLQS
jgi:hypothetical protein